MKLVPFAPNAERFLCGPVGNRKQHGLFFDLVRIGLPGRHDKHIAWSPRDGLSLDLGHALAFQAGKNSRISRAVALALETFRQEGKIRAHGWRRPAAVE